MSTFEAGYYGERDSFLDALAEYATDHGSAIDWNTWHKNVTAIGRLYPQDAPKPGDSKSLAALRESVMSEVHGKDWEKSQPVSAAAASIRQKYQVALGGGASASRPRALGDDPGAPSEAPGGTLQVRPPRDVLADLSSQDQPADEEDEQDEDEEYMSGKR